MNRNREMLTLVLSEVQVIEGGQINNKVLGQTHLFSAYSFSRASQLMIYLYAAYMTNSPSAYIQ